MAIEHFGGGMTDEQAAVYRARHDLRSPDYDDSFDPDYEHEIANALEGVFGSSGHRLRRIVLVALGLAAALVAVSFFAPFFQ